MKHTLTVAQGEPMMFWWNDDLSLVTFVYAAVLAVVAALIVGVTPALKATGRRVQDRLRHASGASSAGLKFGGVWTVVIVMQVAVTVMFVAIVGMLGWAAYVSNGGERPRYFPDTEYVAMQLLFERAPANAPADKPRLTLPPRPRPRPSAVVASALSMTNSRGVSPPSPASPA